MTGTTAPPTPSPGSPAPPERDPFGPRAARTATGVLAAFNEAEILAPGDVHVARRLAALGGRGDPTTPGPRTPDTTAAGATGTAGAAAPSGSEPEPVVLAAALAVRAIRNGSVCVDLTSAATTTAGEGEVAVDVSGLPWPEPTAWRAACADSPLVAVGEDGPTGRPLRLLGNLLYLERYWQEEELVRAEFTARAGPVASVDPQRLCAALDRLLGEPGAERQRLAAAVAALRPVTVIAGGPGTGKTTTVAALLAVLHDLHRASAAPGTPALRVALAAPTGKAAARLTESVAEAHDRLPEADRAAVDGTTASTLHRLLGARGTSGRFRHHRGNRLPHDVVVVDETSMVSLTMMARLLEAVRPDARLVLVGDPEQLASVEAGAVLGDLAAADGRPEPALQDALTACGAFRMDRAVPATGVADPPSTGPGAPLVVRNGVVRLQHNWRFEGTIAAFAAAVQGADADGAVALLRSGATGLSFVDGDAAEIEPRRLDAFRHDVTSAAVAVIGAAEAGDQQGALEALDRHRVLCAHRRGPHGVTRWTAEIERWIETERPGFAAEAPWYPGRPLLVTTNDYDLGLFNGDTGVVVRTPSGRRAVFTRDRSTVAFEPARLGGVGTVHAMTVHRSQGSQFTGITVVLPPADSPLMTRELLYTAVTRAKKSVRIIGTEDAVRAAIGRPAGRASGLRQRLGT